MIPRTTGFVARSFSISRWSKFSRTRERESRDFERVESSINLCDMHNSLRRRGERDKWDQRSLYNQRWMLIQECKMCVFRELNAIGTWTNYAKQMAERFLNAERERESWGHSKIRYCLSRESKSFEFFAISGIRNSVGKIKRKRKKVICVNELFFFCKF